jgi:hypothetical protein
MGLKMGRCLFFISTPLDAGEPDILDLKLITGHQIFNRLFGKTD